MAGIFDSAKDFIDKTTKQFDDLFGPDGTKNLYRSSQLAHRVFGQDTENWSVAQPLLGFQYFVRVNYNGELKSFVEQYFNPVDKWQRNSTFIKEVKLPSIDIETETLNEYNRKRLSQTKINFSPVNISFYDIASGATLKIWQMYYNYYFRDGDIFKSKDTRKRDLVMDGNFPNDTFGYNIDQVENSKHLISNIEIFQIHGGGYTKTTLFNPRITNFAQDTMAYEKNELIQIDYTFEYEWAEYEFRTFNKDNSSFKIADDPELKSFFDQSNFLELDSYTLAEEEGVAEKSTIETIRDNIQSAKDAVESAKSLARNVAGRYNQVSGLANQLQMDLLGTDTPPYPLPSSRRFTAGIESVPTNYNDVKRIRRGDAQKSFPGGNWNVGGGTNRASTDPIKLTGSRPKFPGDPSNPNGNRSPLGGPDNV